MSMKRCPNCWKARAQTFHQVSRVPVNSCLLFGDATKAKEIERGDIELAFCPDCSFVFNAAWKADQTIYSELYEETQAYSPTFNRFHRTIAEELIDRYQIVGKQVVEIGCGKGEFLALLCELGGNDGVGYDPSFVPARQAAGGTKIAFKREFFSEDTVQSPPDLVCCKMTLEHIFESKRFLHSVRRIASPERGTIVFFQVPDVRRILAEAAFWDVYYEHCCYFSPTSLRHLFRGTGFEILRLSSGFDDQYLTIEARATTDGIARAGQGARGDESDEVAELARGVVDYGKAVSDGIAAWSSLIRTTARNGGRVVLWGSGSKAVAFLSAVDADQTVEYLVDINPYRHGKFVPGSGTQIVSPQFLSSYQPDVVVAMNPVYLGEIVRDLRSLGVKARLYALGQMDKPLRRPSENAQATLYA